MTAQFWNALRDIAWLIGTLGGLSLLSIGIGVAGQPHACRGGGAQHLEELAL